ncbi:MAG TPA: hypothetical protein VM344_05530, partial [Vitreimonas sp.]|nr:hypothetical protein [Vitreimonas sp.]
PAAGVRGVIGRLRGVVTILVARDEAEYLWGAIVRLGRPHGLVPVGPAAMSARAGAPAADRRAREPVR